MNVAFVLNDLQLSGGVGVVVHHARELATAGGMDVTLVLARTQEAPDWGYAPLEHLHVSSRDAAMDGRFDVAVSTWWETADTLFALKAERYASFIQSIEDRFYRDDEPERMAAGLVLDLPVTFITEAQWIRQTLADLRPDATCHYVRNGVDKSVFAPLDQIDRRDDQPLRILVEGYASSWFKGVNEAIASTRLMREPHTLTVVAPDREGLDATGATRVLDAIPQRELAALYAETDVVLKLSRIEGMYGPPLEGFHHGATCVTTEVTGHDEFIRHGENALIVGWDDLAGTAAQLDLLARDRDLLHRLRSGALETAREWPSWEQSGAEMAAALRAIAAAPRPDPYAHVPALLADIRGATERHRVHLQERREAMRALDRLEEIKRMPGIRQARAFKEHRAGRAAHRLARRLRDR